jgi:hypothetical protein
VLAARPSIVRNYDSFNSYLNDLVDAINGDTGSVRSLSFPPDEPESDNDTEASGTVYGTVVREVRTRKLFGGIRRWAKKHGFDGRRYR